MLEAALFAGFTSAGADVYALGVIPTPGVGFAVRAVGANGGAVVSASHNPAEYNGVKLFDSGGVKLRDDDEAAIEEYLSDNLLDEWRPTGASIGVVDEKSSFIESYVHFLKGLMGERKPKLRKVIVDCAHGATTVIAKNVLDILGDEVFFVGTDPTGVNINEGVGVMHMEHLKGWVQREGADLGIAFDGDGDRVLFVDRKGQVLDGDIVLWVLARWLKKEGRLGSGVVATVMSNMALEELLAEDGIPCFRAPVGDRYVFEVMECEKALLGGEQSGHVIVRGYEAIGDGIGTALLFLRACDSLGEEVESLADRFRRYPQLLKNVRVCDKHFILSQDAVRDKIKEAESLLKGKGRIFVRPSGTEPMVRILLEARDLDLVSLADELARCIEEIDAKLNAK
jgi:phosphoglucosamine mutase